MQLLRKDAEEVGTVMMGIQIRNPQEFLLLVLSVHTCHYEMSVVDICSLGSNDFNTEALTGFHLKYIE
ncbi:MAG: hypothetical protein ACRDZ4_06945 [Egibacteraceae bacterium]